MLERPTKAELQDAIRKLEQLGDYQTYFGPEASGLSPQVPDYQEYLYLYNLVGSAQLLVEKYDDAEWLEQNHVTDQTFQDALEAMQHAYRGCSLIFGANTQKPTTDTPVATNTPNATTNTTASTGKTSNTTKTTAATVKAEVFTPTTPVATTASTAAVAPAQTNTADNTVNEIAVPATGIVAESSSQRQVSLPALIAVVIAGAVVASIAIAIIIRHEPRRTARSRYRR